jgi:hypothetical protein
MNNLMLVVMKVSLEFHSKTKVGPAEILKFLDMILLLMQVLHT